MKNGKEMGSALAGAYWQLQRSMCTGAATAENVTLAVAPNSRTGMLLGGSPMLLPDLPIELGL